jgi:hypothetical protein
MNKEVKPYLIDPKDISKNEWYGAFTSDNYFNENHFKPIVGYHGGIVKGGLIGGSMLAGAYGLKKAYDTYSNWKQQNR